MVDTYRAAKNIDNSFSRAADRKNQYYSLLYSEMAERRRVEENLRRSNMLLQALSNAQLQYVAGTDLASVFTGLLRTLLEATEAQQGYLWEAGAADSPAGTPTIRLFEGNLAADDPQEDFVHMADLVMRAGRVLLVHPASEHNLFQPAPRFARYYFLGLPITTATLPHHDAAAESANSSEHMVGAIVIAGEADTFDTAMVEMMQPLLATCAQLIVAQRNDMRRRAAERALAEERALLAQRVAERTAELSYSNAELARAARAKDEFLATMNHELRTPLNAVLLYAESLQTQLPGPLNERQMRAATGIRESASHLLLLINDILDVAKMDAGKLTLDIKTTTIDSICQGSLRLVSEMARKKNLSLRVERDNSVQQVDVDERRLKQMLVNLLSNAIKFTPDGGEVGLQVTGKPENNTVQFTVWDTGIGIAPDDIKKLFQPFAQLDSSHVRQHGGTGLGLFLTYRMAELHGGSVHVTSEVGRGSRFTISVPWQHAPRTYAIDALLAPPAPVRQSADDANREQTIPLGEGPTLIRTLPDGGRPQGNPGKNNPVSEIIGNFAASGAQATVLVADDNEANLAVLSDFLHEWNCRIRIARTGVEAVQLAKECHPDLVLMDIQMPEMNGLDAIRLIRKEAAFRNTPIVALTALAMPGDRETCLAAGADDYVSKPIQIERLTEVLNTYLKRMPSEEKS